MRWNKTMNNYEAHGKNHQTPVILSNSVRAPLFVFNKILTSKAKRVHCAYTDFYNYLQFTPMNDFFKELSHQRRLCFCLFAIQFPSPFAAIQSESEQRLQNTNPLFSSILYWNDRCFDSHIFYSFECGDKILVDIFFGSGIRQEHMSGKIIHAKNGYNIWIEWNCVRWSKVKIVGLLSFGSEWLV